MIANNSKDLTTIWPPPTPILPILHPITNITQKTDTKIQISKINKKVLILIISLSVAVVIVIAILISIFIFLKIKKRRAIYRNCIQEFDLEMSNFTPP